MTHSTFLRSFLTASCAAGLLAACTENGSKTDATTPKDIDTVETSSVPPEGTYSLTCSNAEVSNDTLTANCERLDGSSTSTSLASLSACESSINPDGDIGNIDGNLICIPALPLVDGFVFPQTDAMINQWISTNDTNSQIRHGWGLWAGLTAFVGTVDEQPVRAFQTWATPEAMKYRIQNGQFKNVVGHELITKPDLKLALPNQLTHDSIVKGFNDPEPDASVLVSVAYNPPAAEHAIENTLFLESTLNGYLDAGQIKIPDFPDDAITIKPVYKLITAGNTENGIFTMPGWPGTPSPAKKFPETDWNACVYIDMSGNETMGNSIDMGCANRNETNTFSLSNFIHSTLTAEDANYLNAQLSLGTNAAAGDTAILVGMHVTTREIERWTWQSFFWSADANSPYSPSSTHIAALRPDSLDAQAHHYAMTQTYQMVSPVQPVNNGVNEGSAVIGYNPHLEAGFDQGTFNPIRPIDGPDGPITNDFGVQTNCMSCHAMATYGRDNKGELGYVADQYMALNDPLFNEVLQLDFAWSIQGNIIMDETAAKNKASE